MNIHQFYRANEALCDAPLHYLDCGLDNIYLKNGFEVSEDDGDKFLTVTDLDGLHRAIGLHIVLGRKAPSGKELRFLRNEMDMSQNELATMLGLSDQSVARWEKEQCDINGAAVFALRVIYLLSLVQDDEREKIIRRLLAKRRLRRIA